jgi:hypothetical protein
VTEIKIIHMKKKFNLMVFSLIGLISCIAAQTPQKKVFLPYFEAINIKKDYQISTTKLIRNYIETENRYQVMMLEGKDTLFDADQPLAVLKGKAMEMGADYYLKGSLNRIGESVIVNVTLIETATGNKVWFDQLKAMGPEDLDPIMQRIAKALGTDEKAANDNDIYAVTNNESVQLKQKQTNNSFGLSLGGIQMLMPNTLQATMIGVGWYFDARNVIVDIRPSISTNPSKLFMFNVALDLFRPHTTKSNTFFYGGGASFSYTDITMSDNISSYEVDGTGLSFSLGGGYLLNRNAGASVRIGAYAFYALYDLEGSTWSSFGFGSKQLTESSPLGIEIRAEIMFNQ